MIVEPDFVSDLRAADASGLGRHPARQRGCRDSAGLGAPDASEAAESVSERDLRELGGLSRSSGTADDHELMLFQDLGNFRCFRADRQLFGKTADERIGKTVQGMRGKILQIFPERFERGRVP